MGGVGAGEGLFWDAAGNDESRKNAIATEWMVNLCILILIFDSANSASFAVKKLALLCDLSN